MFRRKPQTLAEVVHRLLREQGLETPLLQKRIIDAWPKVVGNMIASYTGDCFIKNQTLMVKINNPALRSDLQMMRTELTQRLNDYVQAQVIADVKIY